MTFFFSLPNSWVAQALHPKYYSLLQSSYEKDDWALICLHLVNNAKTPISEKSRHTQEKQNNNEKFRKNKGAWRIGARRCGLRPDLAQEEMNLYTLQLQLINLSLHAKEVEFINQYRVEFKWKHLRQFWKENSLS